MSDKEVKCPWCGAVGVPTSLITQKEPGDVVQRYCGACKQIIASYLLSAGNFFPKIRVFENKYVGGDE